MCLDGPGRLHLLAGMKRRRRDNGRALVKPRQKEVRRLSPCPLGGTPRDGALQNTVGLSWHTLCPHRTKRIRRHGTAHHFFSSPPWLSAASRRHLPWIDQMSHRLPRLEPTSFPALFPPSSAWAFLPGDSALCSADGIAMAADFTALPEPTALALLAPGVARAALRRRAA